MAPHLSIPERFWTKVDFTNRCWLWTGTAPSGYGQFWDRAKIYAHRWAYQFCVGPIPDGLTIDHLCRIKTCVNPDHLEPVPNRENVLRGVGRSAINARKSHCKRGHEFTPANTIYFPSKPESRVCRSCYGAREAAKRTPEGLLRRRVRSTQLRKEATK